MMRPAWRKCFYPLHIHLLGRLEDNMAYWDAYDACMGAKGLPLLGSLLGLALGGARLPFSLRR